MTQPISSLPHLRSIVVAALVVVALAGCAPSAPALPDKLPAASDPSPTPTEASPFGETVTNAHGNVVKAINQLAGVTLDDGETIGATLRVTAIEVDPKCKGKYADKPKNGHFLAVHLNIETTPELANDSDPELWFDDWQAFDNTGKRVNDPIGNSFGCMDDSDLVPDTIGPGQSVSGLAILDVPTTTGSIVMTMGEPTGWEWSY